MLCVECKEQRRECIINCGGQRVGCREEVTEGSMCVGCNKLWKTVRGRKSVNYIVQQEFRGGSVELYFMT